MTTDRGAATAEQSASAPGATIMSGDDAATARHDRQSRLDKIEYLIGIYRMRYMHYVWRDHMPEAAEVTRKIDRLLERWQRVRDRELAEAVQSAGTSA
ncbi:MAG TPA: hypothetical protein VFH38_07735 [Jatrophihabitans sp.]|nr:hypothetical protein [Jatrophihabitans sp.]